MRRGYVWPCSCFLSHTAWKVMDSLHGDKSTQEDWAGWLNLVVMTTSWEGFFNNRGFVQLYLQYGLGFLRVKG